MAVLGKKELENGATVTVTDQSRVMAGDRWLIKVECAAQMPIADDFYAAYASEDAKLLDAIKEKMGGFLTFAVTKERIFVDAAEKDEVLKGLEEQVSSNMLGYLNNPNFPEKLFAKRFVEVKEECVVAMHYANLKQDDAPEDEPDDFSACFKD